MNRKGSDTIGKVGNSGKKAKGLKIIQVNIGKNKEGMDEFREWCVKNRVQVALVQEPYTRPETGLPVSAGVGVRTVYDDRDGGRVRAAIYVYDGSLDVLKVARCTNKDTAVAVVEAGGERLVCVSSYCESAASRRKRENEELMKGSINELEGIVEKFVGERIIIGADANAKSDWWFSGKNDERGDLLEEFILEKELCVINKGGFPKTYRGHIPSKESNVDVTLGTEEMIELVEWVVHKDEHGLILADHRTIEMTLKWEGGEIELGKGRIRTEEVDWEEYRRELDWQWSRRGECSKGENELEERVKRVTEIIVRASEKVCGRKNRGNGRGVKWWNEVLNEKKREVRKCRREYQKAQGREKMKRKYELKRKQREFKNLIAKQRYEGWKQFVTEVGGKDPWSVIYKMQTGKMKTETVISAVGKREGGETKDITETLQELCKKMFPEDRREGENEEHKAIRENAEREDEVEGDYEVEEEELYAGLMEMKNGKAPGVDEVEVKVVKESWNIVGEELLWIVKEMLKTGKFPSDWKVGKLVILLKGGKPPDEVGSYRPITLLSVLGKLAEKVIVRKIRRWMGGKGVVNEKQYGFMPGKGTADALHKLKRIVKGSTKTYVAGVFVDVKGAFDNAWPPLVLSVLKEFECPGNIYKLIRDYLEGRKIKVGKVMERFMWLVAKGCPQGSVLGPVIWLILLHDWLRREFGDNVHILAYADDIVILVEENARKRLEKKLNEIVENLRGWLHRAKLEWSIEKTKGVLLKGAVIQGVGCIRHKSDWRPVVKLGEEIMEWVNSIVYLGVEIDESWLFGKHVKKAAVKATTMMNKMKRVNRSSWGVGFSVMNTIYEGAYLPILLYGAGVWHERVEQKHVKRILRASQRAALLATTSAYRTVSWGALVALCGKLPVERVVRIRGKVEERRCELREQGVPKEERRMIVKGYERELREQEWDEWETEYGEEEMDRKIGRVKNVSLKEKVISVKEWAKEKRIVDRWIVGYVTGHIGVGKYLFEHGKEDSGVCQECQVEESVEHVVWECTKYIGERNRIEEKLEGVGNKRDLSNRKVYEAIRKGFKVMCDKMDEERRVKRMGGGGEPENVRM